MIALQRALPLTLRAKPRLFLSFFSLYLSCFLSSYRKPTPSTIQPKTFSHDIALWFESPWIHSGYHSHYGAWWMVHSGFKDRFYSKARSKPTLFLITSVHPTTSSPHIDKTPSNDGTRILLCYRPNHQVGAYQWENLWPYLLHNCV